MHIAQNPREEARIIPRLVLGRAEERLCDVLAEQAVVHRERRQVARAVGVQRAQKARGKHGVNRREQRAGAQARVDELLRDLRRARLGGKVVLRLVLEAPARRLVRERLLLELVRELRNVVLQTHTRRLFQALAQLRRAVDVPQPLPQPADLLLVAVHRHHNVAQAQLPERHKEGRAKRRQHVVGQDVRHRLDHGHKRRLPHARRFRVGHRLVCGVVRVCRGDGRRDLGRGRVGGGLGGGLGGGRGGRGVGGLGWGGLGSPVLLGLDVLVLLALGRLGSLGPLALGRLRGIDLHRVVLACARRIAHHRVARCGTGGGALVLLPRAWIIPHGLCQQATYLDLVRKLGPRNVEGDGGVQAEAAQQVLRREHVRRVRRAALGRRPEVHVLEQRLLHMVQRAAERLDVRLVGGRDKDARLALLRHEDQQRERQVARRERRKEPRAALFVHGARHQHGGRHRPRVGRRGDVCERRLALQQRPARQRGDLRLGQLTDRFDARHLLHELGQDDEVLDVVAPQLVHEVLHQRRAVHRGVLFVERARKRREALEPEARVRPVRLGAVLLGVAQRLDQAERKHVVLERRQVLGRVDHRLDQVVVRLDLVQRHAKEHGGVRVRRLGQAPPAAPHIVGAHAAQNAARLALRLAPPERQLAPLVRAVLPLAPHTEALRVRQLLQQRPHLVQQRRIRRRQRDARQQLRTHQREPRVGRCAPRRGAQPAQLLHQHHVLPDLRADGRQERQRLAHDRRRVRTHRHLARPVAHKVDETLAHTRARFGRIQRQLQRRHTQRAARRQQPPKCRARRAVRQRMRSVRGRNHVPHHAQVHGGQRGARAKHPRVLDKHRAHGAHGAHGKRRTQHVQQLRGRHRRRRRVGRRILRRALVRVVVVDERRGHRERVGAEARALFRERLVVARTQAREAVGRRKVGHERLERHEPLADQQARYGIQLLGRVVTRLGMCIVRKLHAQHRRHARGVPVRLAQQRQEEGVVVHDMRRKHGQHEVQRTCRVQVEVAHERRDVFEDAARTRVARVVVLCRADRNRTCPRRARGIGAGALRHQRGATVRHELEQQRRVPLVLLAQQVVLLLLEEGRGADLDAAPLERLRVHKLRGGQQRRLGTHTHSLACQRALRHERAQHLGEPRTRRGQRHRRRFDGADVVRAVALLAQLVPRIQLPVHRPHQVHQGIRPRALAVQHRGHGMRRRRAVQSTRAQQRRDRGVARVVTLVQLSTST